MRFERLRARGIGEFAGEIDVDLSAMDGQVIAVCGKNGAGKTTFLELMVGALYRQCPTRGPLAKLARDRDAFVEVRAVNGKAWTIRQTVDGISGKGEALVMDEAGRPVVESGKLRDYDAWSKAHLPPPEITYSGPFAVQLSRGILDMKASERKAMLVRLLGVDRLEQQTEAARKRAGDARERAARYRELAADQEAAAEKGSSHREAVRELDAEIVQADQQVQALEDALRRARAAAEDAERAAEIAAQRRAAQGRLTQAEEKLADVRARLANNRGLLDQATEIRAAVIKAAELEAHLDELTRAESDAGRAAWEMGRQVEAAELAAKQLEERVFDAQHRRDRAKARLEQEHEVVAAKQAAENHRMRLDFLDKEIATARGVLEQLQRQRLAGADERITGLRGGLQTIDAGADDAQAIARQTLDRDDAAVRLAEELPREVAAARDALRALERERVEVSGRLAERDKIAALAGQMDAAREDRAAAEKQIADLRPRWDTERARKSDAERIAEKKRADHRQLQEELTAVQRERSALDPLLKRAAPLDQAEARIEELEGQERDWAAAAAAARTELDGLPEVKADEAPDLEAREHAVRRAKGVAEDLRERRGRELAHIEAAEQAAKKAAEHRARQTEAEQDQADWTRLAQDLGRDGLQAMEIDAALPELNALANEFLTECLGTRFTVELKTDRLSADGKKLREELDIRVIDNEKGRDDLAETYSPGECAVVGEAIALALTTISCGRSGIERPTLVRDETAGGLDEESRRAYVKMLRKAAKMLNAEKVLFVSHSRDMQDLADARIEIVNRQVEVRA